MTRRNERQRTPSKPVGSLLIVAGGSHISDKMANEFRQRGYTIECADSMARVEECDLDEVDFAVVDLELRDGSGLDVVEEIKRRSPEIRVVVVSSRTSIATAVKATKLGAVQYLTMPVDTASIERALLED